MLRVLAIAGLAVAGLLGLALVGLILLVGTGTLKLYAIPSSAMEPTLRCARPAVGCEGGTKDRVFAWTRFISYDRGDIVVFDTTAEARSKCGAGGTFVKRIVGLPGERLELRIVDGREHVFIEGEELPEPYVDDERRGPGPGATFMVPADAYFVLGDNRAQSCDSRTWGPLSEDNLKGKLVGTYWPPGRWTIR